jgi:hypothetical protein
MATSPERERIIRAAWDERGSRAWDPATHGQGLLPLHIQAKADMRPARFGRPLPPHDNLKFRLVPAMMGGQAIHSIVCEDIVVATLPTSEP